MESAYYTVLEAARHLGVSTDTVYRMCVARQVDAVKVRGAWRVRRQNLHQKLVSLTADRRGRRLRTVADGWRPDLSPRITTPARRIVAPPATDCKGEFALKGESA